MQNIQREVTRSVFVSITGLGPEVQLCPFLHGQCQTFLQVGLVAGFLPRHPHNAIVPTAQQVFTRPLDHKHSTYCLPEIEKKLFSTLGLFLTHARIVVLCWDDTL